MLHVRRRCGSRRSAPRHGRRNSRPRRPPPARRAPRKPQNQAGSEPRKRHRIAPPCMLRYNITTTGRDRIVKVDSRAGLRRRAHHQAGHGDDDNRAPPCASSSALEAMRFHAGLVDQRQQRAPPEHGEQHADAGQKSSPPCRPGRYRESSDDAETEGAVCQRFK